MDGVRATERITDTSREPVLSLLVRVGDGCAALHDGIVQNLACEGIECDGLWGFVQKKQRWVTDADAANYGDTWTNLVPSHKAIRMTPAMADDVTDHACRRKNSWTPLWRRGR